MLPTPSLPAMNVKPLSPFRTRPNRALRAFHLHLNAPPFNIYFHRFHFPRLPQCQQTLIKFAVPHPAIFPDPRSKSHAIPRNISVTPYFLKKPFSCAITKGEQSVSAMIPNLISDTSGASLANTDPIQPVGRPLNKAPNPNPLADLERKLRRVRPCCDSRATTLPGA